MQFLLEYGYLILFIVIFLDQAGLPLPSDPFILTAGALAGAGEMSAAIIVLVTVLACVPADLSWFYLGKTRGGKVLNLLCSISLEPDYCVRRTETSFDRLGVFSLIIAKFIPGLQTLAPPMAGFTQMSTSKFLALDITGATLWAGALTYIGFLFSDELAVIASRFAELGGIAAIIILSLFVVFIGYKLIQRQLFLRSLRMRMLLPQEVRDKLDAKESLYIIDLRHRLDFNALPYAIPGAVRVPMEKIQEHYHAIPRDQDIILYCS